MRLARGLVIAVASLGFASTARATVVVPMSFEELVTEADAILHGRVQDVRSQWMEGGRRIETLVTVAVTGTFKGVPRETITFRTAGGEVGPFRTIVPGAPLFRTADEVVLFVRGAAPALPVLLGFNQGVLRVTHDPLTGSAFIVPAPVLRDPTTAQRVSRGTSTRISLTDLQQRVASLLDRVPRRPRRDR